MVGSDSPRLCITNSGWLDLRSKANLVSTLWECMSDDDWYVGLTLSFQIRSKDLTAYEIWQFKIVQQKLPGNMGPRSKKTVFNSTPFLTLEEWHIFGCACLKCKLLRPSLILVN